MQSRGGATGAVMACCLHSYFTWPTLIAGATLGQARRCKPSRRLKKAVWSVAAALKPSMSPAVRSMTQIVPACR